MSNVSESQPNGSDRILNEALALFKLRGYHGTSVRSLAQAASMEVASLYYHFSSKQEILLALFERTMDAMLDGFERAITSGDTPASKLRAAVRFHVLFHVARQDEAFVSHSELRSLDGAGRKLIVDRRDRYERMLRSVLEAGVQDGEFEIADVRIASTAILVMCSGVSDWFGQHGRLAAGVVAERYAEMVLRLVAPSKSERCGKITHLH